MKIDLILCKSTSRFARNTVDCLENVRLLKSLGIGVIFEKENVNTLTMAKRCPNSKVIGTAMIPDYELEFRKVATIVPKKGAEVPVLMWEIDQQDEINLNHYEGFPRLYRKEIFEMEVNGKIREGMAYLMNYKGIAPPTAQ